MGVQHGGASVSTAQGEGHRVVELLGSVGWRPRCLGVQFCISVALNNMELCLLDRSPKSAVLRMYISPLHLNYQNAYMNLKIRQTRQAGIYLNALPSTSLTNFNLPSPPKHPPPPSPPHPNPTPLHVPHYHHHHHYHSPPQLSLPPDSSRPTPRLPPPHPSQTLD